MESKLVVNTIVFGGALFAGMILFWFIFVHFKKRLAPDKSNLGFLSPDKISWEEKRAHPRSAISWQASIDVADRTDEVQLKDISLGGAFVVCREPLTLNDKFKISLNLPNQDPLQLSAEVVWSNANVPLDKVVNRGMGIRFIMNTEKERRCLQDAIAAAFEKSDDTAERMR